LSGNASAACLASLLLSVSTAVLALVAIYVFTYYSITSRGQSEVREAMQARDAEARPVATESYRG
jgi:hypothetical protein